MRLKNKRVLVTGGCGLVGSHIAEKCLFEGANVKIIDNLITGDIKNISQFQSSIEFINGDIRNKDLVERITKDIDIIFHQAAHLNPAKAVIDPFYDFDVNMKGTLNLLFSGIKNNVEKFIMASTYVHGRASTSKISEDFSTLFHKNSLLTPYSAAKVSAEAYLKVANDEMGLPTVRLRYTNVYGPRQRSKSESGVIALYFKWALTNQDLILYDKGIQKRDFVYISDVVEANILAAINNKANGGVFNIGSGAEISIIDIANKIKKEVNDKINIKYANSRAADFLRANIDISRAKEELNYLPQIEFNLGFQNYHEWCLNNILSL